MRVEGFSTYAKILYLWTMGIAAELTQVGLEPICLTFIKGGMICPKILSLKSPDCFKGTASSVSPVG